VLIRDLNPDERPMERLIRNGPELLSDSELIAIIFGGQTALRAARALLAEGLSRVPNSPRLSGLSPIRLARVRAVFELSRRIHSASLPPPDLPSHQILGPRLVAKYRDYVQEHVGAIYLDTRHRIIARYDVFIGTLHSATASPRELLRHALLESAAALIVYHNHPSGDPTPSPDDRQFTQTLLTSADAMGIELLDHLVLGRNDYVSMRARGLLKGPIK
jgi:DNA repair protein RadC